MCVLAWPAFAAFNNLGPPLEESQGHWQTTQKLWPATSRPLERPRGQNLDDLHEMHSYIHDEHAQREHGEWQIPSDVRGGAYRVIHVPH